MRVPARSLVDDPPPALEWIDPPALGSPRLLAIVSGTVLLGASASVLYRVTDVLGGRPWLLLAIVAGIGLATIGSRGLPTRVGIGLGALLLVVGLGAYLLLIPRAYYALFTLERVYVDLTALGTGQSVLLLLNADRWAIAVAPAPAFLVWYLTLRRAYAAAALAGGLALGFFALTGDAGRTTTVVGMTAGLALVGFGSIDRWDGTTEQMQDLGLLLVLAIVVARVVKVVPGSEQPAIGGGDGDPASIEARLVEESGRIEIGGSITLSEEVRFTVSAPEPAYWRTGAFDRYTGNGWARSGRTRSTRRADPPPGATSSLRQTVRIESSMTVMPAAWKPMEVLGDPADRIGVTPLGGFRPVDRFTPGDTYTVVSFQPEWTPETLDDAGGRDPPGVLDRYLQLPDSTPARLERRARAIAADAETRLATARSIERWLKREKRYSLTTRSVGWDTADAFVFEMDRGYCVHFATAMAVMLRTVRIPARLAVGYHTGERVAEGRWRVRGLDAHAWVEVFFPSVGWVTFDPTPGDARAEAHRTWLARDQPLVDPDAEPVDTPTPTPTVTESTGEPAASPTPSAETNVENATVNASADPMALPYGGDALEAYYASDAGFDPDAPDGESTPSDGDAAAPAPRPIWERDRVSVVAGALGLVLGAYRLGVLDRTAALDLAGPDGATPAPVIAGRAAARLERRLGRTHRDRAPEETLRQYVEAIGRDHAVDDRVWRVVELYELVRYSDGGTVADAREAVRLVSTYLEES